MEIYKDLNSSEQKEFANLLDAQSNLKIEEGKIFEATVTKISQKYCWVYLEGLKSEPAIDINEIKAELACKKEDIADTAVPTSLVNIDVLKDEFPDR